MTTNYEKLNDLFQVCVARGLKDLVIGSNPYKPWNDEDFEGFKKPSFADKVTPETIKIFRDNGWCLEPGDNGTIYATPIVFIEPPAMLYHLTPFSNRESILASGLLTGIQAGQSTSGRRYCQDSIYVCISEDKAREWKAEELIGRSGHKEWALFGIHRRHLTGRVYRDPASQTGYILEDKKVRLLEFLERIGG